jgi:hypothetical protein
MNFECHGTSDHTRSGAHAQTSLGGTAHDLYELAPDKTVSVVSGGDSRKPSQSKVARNHISNRARHLWNISDGRGDGQVGGDASKRTQKRRGVHFKLVIVDALKHFEEEVARGRFKLSCGRPMKGDEICQMLDIMLGCSCSLYVTTSYGIFKICMSLYC